MNSLVRRFSYIAIVLAVLGMTACSDEKKASSASPSNTDFLTTFDVYKSPTCGCCNDWIKHLEQAGFEAETHHPTDLNKVKRDHGIPPSYQSCHTAVSQDGYVFEGHIPARFIQQFMDNPPSNAIGLAVPSMPPGSPGMEMGDRFHPYSVFLLKADGTNAVFAEVKNAQDQYK